MARTLLADCETWDTLVSDRYLSQQIIRFQQAEADKKNALDEAKEKQCRSKRLEQQQEAGKKKLKTLEDTISRLGEELNERKQIISGWMQQFVSCKSSCNIRIRMPQRCRFSYGKTGVMSWEIKLLKTRRR